MRLIDADKIYPDCMTKDGKLAISQSQLANAPTVDTYTIEDIQEVRENALILGAKLAQRPQGEWIDEGVNGWKCNKCGYGVLRYNNTNFCPKCGADMRKGGAE